MVTTSPSRAGTAFYYTNTLHQRRAGVPARPDVTRTLASLAGHVATVDDDGVQVHQYATAEIRITLADGQPIDLAIDTAYPRDGLIRVTVRSDAPAPWTLTLRVPAWAGGARLAVRPAGEDADTQLVAPGTVAVRRAFRAGDVVELCLPVTPRWSVPDPRIDAVRGCVVVERGPEVFCLESVDLVAASAGAVRDVGTAARCGGCRCRGPRGRYVAAAPYRW